MIAACMHRKLTLLLFLFFSTASTGLLAQVVEDPQGPGGGNPQPPIPWAITTPNGNLGIAGTANMVDTTGTWPLNDPGWTSKYIKFEAATFTDPVSNKAVGHSVIVGRSDVSGNWSESFSFPSHFKENKWPVGTRVYVSIGQSRLITTEITNPETGLTQVVTLTQYQEKKRKTFTVVNP